MSCSRSQALAANEFELHREEARNALDQTIRLAEDLIFDPDGSLRGSKNEAQIRSLLLKSFPNESLGVNEVMTFANGVFKDNLRNYRHPLHFGHQRPGPCLASLIADILNGATNATVSVFEAGPVSVSIEKTVQDWFLELFSMQEGSASTFTNGGSESALTALICAKRRWLAENPDRDFSEARLLIGEDAHYCFVRAARVIGLREEQVHRVWCGKQHDMCIRALEAEIEAVTDQKGASVFCIVGTAGSTPAGTFDDIKIQRWIADDCKAWLHIDASHGGAAVFSSEYKHLIEDIETADSFQFNPHKMMWLSPPCALFFVKERRHLELALANDLSQASYLLNRASNEHEDLPDENLEVTLACTRQFSALKVYCAAVMYGIRGIGQRIVNACKIAEKLAELVDNDPRFELFMSPAFNIVLFRPKQFAGYDKELRCLRDDIANENRIYLTGTEVDGSYWLRAQCTSENNDEAHLACVLDIVSDYANQEKFNNLRGQEVFT